MEKEKKIQNNTENKSLKVIGLTGFARSGKDTVAKFLSVYNYRKYAFADKVRELALEIDPIVLIDRKKWWQFWKPNSQYMKLSEAVYWMGWEEAKKFPSVRGVLQDLGEGCRRVFYNDIWVEHMFKKIEKDKSERVVISDVRYPNEAESIRNKYGGVIIKITSPGVGPVNKHISDNLVNELPIDATLVNEKTKTGLTKELKISLLRYVSKKFNISVC